MQVCNTMPFLLGVCIFLLTQTLAAGCGFQAVTAKFCMWLFGRAEVTTVTPEL